MSSDWYALWFGELYDKLYGHRDELQAKQQVQRLMKELNLNKNAPILDLACGNGRHLRAFEDAGYTNVFGADLSVWQLQKNKNKQNLIRSDMRNVPFIKHHFQLVCLFFTSFGYFDQESQDLQVIASVHKILQKNGYFLLDLPNASYVKQSLPRKTVDAGLKGSGIQEIVQNRTLRGNRVHKSIEIGFESGKTERFSESVRLYEKDEIKMMLDQNNFQIIRISGSEKGEVYTPDSSRMELLCQAK